jgi:rhodanese-related sulfurtransferase
MRYNISTVLKISAQQIDEENLLPALQDFLDKTKEDWNYITPEEFQKLREKDKDFYILDIRHPEDFKKGYIPGAKNIFWLDILNPENLKKLPRDKKIMIYCYVGHTSSQVLVLLKLLGYDVVALKFGMGISPVEGVPVAGWMDFGFKITK